MAMASPMAPFLCKPCKVSWSHSNGPSLGLMTGCLGLLCSSYRIPNASSWGGKCNFFPLETKVEQALAEVFVVGSGISRLTGNEKCPPGFCLQDRLEGRGRCDQTGGETS